ncbi:uncharacterized protein LOC119182165 isoform X4 [Rhipicephalus microplus]|uniref:uncharacterized protein LOC119182165 isoform X4 n=1 Tax=Rhipicephalus microplus TaxID=6941 RepID=UPI003F6CAE36
MSSRKFRRLQDIMKAPIRDRVVYSPYPSVEIPECSFYTLAKKQLLVNPDKLLLVSDVVSLTRKETLAHMKRYAIGFRNNGVSPGHRICIHLDNGVENLVAIYGCILAGAIVVLAKPSLTENELRYQWEDSDSTHILTEQKYAEKVVRTAAALSMKGIFCMGPAPGFISTPEFLNLDERDFLEVPVEKPRDTVLAVIYTSGSTGLPKGTEITHYNYVAAFYCTTRHLPWSSSDILLASLPITHQSGMMFTMLGALGGTISVMTPSTMTPLEFMDTSHKYKIVDVTTRNKLGPHQIGEICFRTPSMVRGYYKRPRESAELFDEEGWCKSGDAGYYDEDGRLYISERLKQMIKCMDNQVVPSELEELLLRMHPTQIAEVSVVGLKHSEYGEAPAAAVVLTEEGKKQDLTTFINDVKATVSNNLAVHKHLYGGVFIVDCLPKTETAKVNRPALARSLACQ